jgi:hypothetical protein
MRFAGGGRIRGPCSDLTARGAYPMTDLLFVGVTVLVFVVLALIVKAVEKL